MQVAVCVKWCLPGSVIRDLVTEGFAGAGHRGTVCPAHPSIKTARRKTGVYHKPHCLRKQLRGREPFLSGNGGKPSKIQVSRC